MILTGLGELDGAECDVAGRIVRDGGLLRQRGVLVLGADGKAELVGVEGAAGQLLLEREVVRVVDSDRLGVIGVVEDAAVAVAVRDVSGKLAVAGVGDLDGHLGRMRVVGVAGGRGTLLGHAELIGAGLGKGHGAEREALGLPVLGARDGGDVGALGDLDRVAVVVVGSELEREGRCHVAAGQGLLALDGCVARERDLAGFVGVRKGTVLHLGGGDKLTLAVIGNGNGDGSLAVIVAHTADGALNLGDLVDVGARLIEGEVAERGGLGVLGRLGGQALGGRRRVTLRLDGELEEVGGLPVAAIEDLGHAHAGGKDDGLCSIGVGKGRVRALGDGSHELAVLLLNADLDDVLGLVVSHAVVALAQLGDGELIGAGSRKGDVAEGGLVVGGLGVDGELGGIGHGDGGSVARGLLKLELEGVAVGPVAAGEVLGHGEVRRAAQRAGPRLVGVGHGEHAGALNRLTIGGVIAVDGGLDHEPGDLAHAGGDDNLLGPAVHGGQLERVAVILAVLLLELDGHGAGELGTVGVRPLLLYGHGVDRGQEGRDIEAVGFLARNLVVLARLLEDGLVEDLGANPVIGGKLGRLAFIDGSIVCRLARLDLEGHLVGRALLELTDGLEVPAQGSVLADYSGRRLGPGLPVLLIAHRREVNRAVSGGARHVLGKFVDDLNVLVARGLRDGLDNVGKSRVELLGVRAVERGAAGSLLREAVHLFGSLGTGINGKEARNVGRTLVGLVDGVVEVLVPVGGTVAGSSPVVPTIGRLAIRKENDVGRSIGVLIRLGVRLGKGVDPIGASIGSQPIDGVLEVGRLATGVVLARSVSPFGERLERQLDGTVIRCDQLVGEAVESLLRDVEARLARLMLFLAVHIAGVRNLVAARVFVVVIGARTRSPVPTQNDGLPVDHAVGVVPRVEARNLLV